MSLALCLYYTEDTRQLTKYPKILLLDEIDAPLHPSMARVYLDVLQNTVVRKHNIFVIATTHSPSTVALAPEDAIYVIEPNRSGLQKTSKSRALNVLTDGVPTLAISYDGRRQVFVESPWDAQLYDALHQILKTRLRSERSLEFVATGFNSPNASHVNTGCDLVRHLVNSLASAGNKSVFGLIDWDGKNDPTSRISVLAHQRRNGLENVLFDPLLLAALIVRHNATTANKIGVSDSYFSLLKWSPEKLQPVVSAVQSLVLKKTSLTFGAPCAYVGGFDLSIDDSYLKMDDHSLEDAILEAFPVLRSIARGRAGALMQSVVNHVIRDQPDFLPWELHTVLHDLLVRND